MFSNNAASFVYGLVVSIQWAIACWKKRLDINKNWIKWQFMDRQELTGKKVNVLS